MSLFRSFLDLLYPPRCPFCSSLLSSFKSPESKLSWAAAAELEGLLCRQCMEKVPWLEEESCPRCGHTRETKEDHCPYCSSYHFAYDFCCALGHYRAEMRAAVHRYKYGGQKGLAPALAELLFLRLKATPWAASLEAVVPVPLSRGRLAQRGYNQAFLLAEVLAQKLELPVLDILEKVRETASQTGLSRAQRKGNMEGAFCCRGTLPQGSCVLLVDDVLTSGATSHVATSVLKESGGASRVGLAVLAR